MSYKINYYLYEASLYNLLYNVAFLECSFKFDLTVFVCCNDFFWQKKMLDKDKTFIVIIKCG